MGTKMGKGVVIPFHVWEYNLTTKFSQKFTNHDFLLAISTRDVLISSLITRHALALCYPLIIARVHVTPITNCSRTLYWRHRFLNYINKERSNIWNIHNERYINFPCFKLLLSDRLFYIFILLPGAIKCYV